jgi:hypothetical protein
VPLNTHGVVGLFLCKGAFSQRCCSTLPYGSLMADYPRIKQGF